MSNGGSNSVDKSKEKKLQKPLQFFLGANTPQGFVSLFDCITQQENWRCFIIKGGPGCGKSTLMCKVAQAFDERCAKMEYILCSSDPASVDAIIIPEIGAAIADGTPPHSIELKYPGAVETIIDMGQCWNEKILQSKRVEIIELFKQNERYNAQATVFLGIAGTLSDINRDIASAYTDTDKALRLAGKICRSEFEKGSGSGADSKRFLSGICGEGQVMLESTISSLADKVYLLEDNYGVFAQFMLEKIRSYALENGYDTISCNCPMHPNDKLEHLFIPELSLAFATANHFHTPNVNPFKVINSRRFTNRDKLKAHKKTLAENRSTSKDMLALAYAFLTKAKQCHNTLEGCYNSAMQFEETAALVAKVVDKMECIALSC